MSVVTVIFAQKELRRKSLALQVHIESRLLDRLLDKLKMIAKFVLPHIIVLELSTLMNQLNFLSHVLMDGPVRLVPESQLFVKPEFFVTIVMTQLLHLTWLLKPPVLLDSSVNKELRLKKFAQMFSSVHQMQLLEANLKEGNPSHALLVTTYQDHFASSATRVSFVLQIHNQQHRPVPLMVMSVLRVIIAILSWVS